MLIPINNSYSFVNNFIHAKFWLLDLFSLSNIVGSIKADKRNLFCAVSEIG